MRVRSVGNLSMNVEDYTKTALAKVIEAIARRATVAEAELVGLAPRAALEGLPDELTVGGRATIEDALATADKRLS